MPRRPRAGLVRYPERLAARVTRRNARWLLRPTWLEDRPRYNKTRCFENFPFPELASPVRDAELPDASLRENNAALAQKLSELGEQLDAHRKRQQAAHAELTLTGMYNVLEKLKSGEALNAKEKIIHEQGLVSVLKSLHDEIDLGVLEAYGWADLKPLMQRVNGNQSGLDLTRTDAIRELDEALLERLVALNAERAQEEKRGLIRYLRPEFQDPNFKTAGAPKQSKLAVDREEDDTAAPQPAKTEKISWPKTLPEQVRALLELLKTETLPAEEIAARFTGLKAPKLRELLETLVDMGRARETEAGFGV